MISDWETLGSYVKVSCRCRMIKEEGEGLQFWTTQRLDPSGQKHQIQPPSLRRRWFIGSSSVVSPSRRGPRFLGRAGKAFGDHDEWVTWETTRQVEHEVRPKSQQPY